MSASFRKILDRRHSGRPINLVPPTVRQVKTLIWVYFWLLIFEGALRKWVLPSFSDPLLIVRDPVVLLIYLQAVRGGFYPQHWLVKLTMGLGIFTFFWGCMQLAGSSSITVLLVTIYGVRTFFLHLPFIFIIGHVFTREDVLKVGRWCLILAVPMTFLMVAQYGVDAGHVLNRGTQGAESGQMVAAMGKIRPAGTFSFGNGPGLFYPFVVVFLIYGVMDPKAFPKWLLLAAAAATALVLPVSGSRGLVLGCAVVVAYAVVALFRLPALVPRFAVWAGVIFFSGVGMLALPVGQEAVESFLTRWEQAADSEGDGQGADVAIANRVGGNFLEVFSVLDTVPLGGVGIGAGTNVGVMLMTGGVGFLYGEAEWTRSVMEAGPLVGFAYIGFRMLLAFYILRLAWLKLRRGDPLSWLLMGSCFVLLLMGQTTQATMLGFMVFISGLSMASVGVMQRAGLAGGNRLHWSRRRQLPPEAGPGVAGGRR